MTSIWPVAGAAPHRYRHVLSPLTLFIVLPAAAAWTTLVALGLISPAASLCLAPRSALASTLADAASASLALLSPAGVIETALIMTAAMALPLAWRPAIHVQTRSFERHRFAAVTIFVLSLGMVWIIVLAFMAVVGVTAKAVLTTALPAPLLGATAALLTAIHRTSNEANAALARCHHMDPIRPFQPAMKIDIARFGGRSAFHCARLCWPAMLLPWLSSQPLLAMPIVTLLAIDDRTAHRASSRPAIVVLTLFALIELTTPL